MLPNLFKICKKSIGWIKATLLDKGHGTSSKEFNVPLSKKAVCCDSQFLSSKVLNLNTLFISNPIILPKPTTLYHQNFNVNSLFDLQHFSMTRFTTPSHKNFSSDQLKSKLNAQNRFGFSSKKKSSKIINQLAKKIEELSKKEQYEEIIKLMDSRKAKKLTPQRLQLLYNVVSSNLNIQYEMFDFVGLTIFCSILQQKGKLMEKSEISEEDIEDFLSNQLKEYLKGKKNVDLLNGIGYNFKNNPWQFAIDKDFKLRLFKKQNDQQLLFLFYKVKENGVEKYIVRKSDDAKGNKSTSG